MGHRVLRVLNNGSVEAGVSAVREALLRPRHVPVVGLDERGLQRRGKVDALPVLGQFLIPERLSPRFGPRSAFSSAAGLRLPETARRAVPRGGPRATPDRTANVF